MPKLAQSVTGSPDRLADLGRSDRRLPARHDPDGDPAPAPLRDDLTFDHSRPRGTIEWITAIDEDRLWADLAAKLGPAR